MPNHALQPTAGAGSVPLSPYTFTPKLRANGPRPPAKP